MKTSLLFGATLAVVGAAIVSVSGQTQSASPATTASPHPTPALPGPRATTTATPSVTASPTTRPAAIVSPSGGAQLEGELPPTMRESLPAAATPAGKTKPTPARPHRKLERREGVTPSEGTGEQK